MSPEFLNKLDEQKAIAELQRCCGCLRWATQMSARRPFRNSAELFQAADEIWWQLGREDWLEAFSHHPKIGNMDKLREKFASTAGWSAGEQSGVNDAAEETLRALADGNRKYEEKFGYIFIVCATGKTADQMLALLNERLPNEAGAELKIAAGEQSKITRIRLEKLCQEVQSQPMS